MRWKQTPAAISTDDLGVPDALAVRNSDGELIGWDNSPVCTFYAERDEPCDDECAARGHIEPS